jgi:hypothetical protein
MSPAFSGQATPSRPPFTSEPADRDISIMGTPGLAMRMTAQKVTIYCLRRHSISSHDGHHAALLVGLPPSTEAPAANGRGFPADARAKNVSMSIGHTPGQTEIAGQRRTPYPPQYPRITPELWQISVIRHLANKLRVPRASRREAQPDCVPGLPDARIEIVLATACAVRSPTSVVRWAASWPLVLLRRGAQSGTARQRGGTSAAGPARRELSGEVLAAALGPRHHERPYPTLVRLSQFLSFLGLVRGSSRTWPVRAETAACRMGLDRPCDSRQLPSGRWRSAHCWCFEPSQIVVITFAPAA